MCQNALACENALNNVFDTIRQRGYRQYKNKVKRLGENNFVRGELDSFKLSKDCQNLFGIETATI